MPIDDDAYRRTMSQARQPTSKLRIVGYDRPGADHDCVVSRTQGVCALSRRRTGDPLALAAPGRDAAVERSGKLQRDERPAVAETAEETGVDLGGFRRTETRLDVESRRAQSPHAFAGDARVGILYRDHYPPYPCGDQCIGARRGAAPMAARFETDIGGGAARGFAGPAERLGLAMRSPTGLCPAAPHDTAAIDDDAADCRVWPDRAEAAPRQRQRGAHRTKT